MKNYEKEISEYLNQINNNCVVEKVSNIDKFALCKVKDIGYCEHMINYGYTKYCIHPAWRSFIEKESNRIDIPS